MRAFIAIDVADEIKGRLYKAESELSASGIKLVSKDEMHITLQFLGNIGENDIAAVKAGMNGIHGFGAFSAEVRGVGVFTPEYIRVVFASVAEGSIAITNIYNELDKLLPKTYKEERSFIPHITLARVKHLENKETISKFIEKYNSASFGEFEVKSIKLEQSTLTPAGPLYKTLYEVEL